MELILTRPDATALQVTVTCDGQVSHTFDLSSLIPTKANGLPHSMTDPIAYGTALYAALFPPDSLAHKALTQESERLLLVAHDEQVDAVPWEYLHGPDGFVVCNVPFVRGLPPEQRIPPPEQVGSLHILAVPSNPLDPHLAPLNIEGEWMRLADSVRGLNSAVTLERVWPTTIERLRTLVANQQQRVVHFMGHGGQNERKEAVLYFEQDNGTLELINAREFTKRLRGSVLLVTLNACKSAEPGETHFSNLAGALVREQVPYALGMRFAIHDDDALTFSRTFYANLARSVPVEEAVFQMRLSLGKSMRPWAIGVPVLYTALTTPAGGFAAEPGTPVVHAPQENALRGVIGALPQVEGAFQGRFEELVQLGDWLTGDRRPRIMTIHGSGGQGKTALARVAAERFAHAWPGGVWAISLETLPTRALFVGSLARFLGFAHHDSVELADLERQVLLRLRQRRTLIILDNAETLVEASEAQERSALDLVAFIEQFPSPFVSLLITSRRFLGWSGEKFLELKGLPPAEGTALFRQSAPQRLHEIDPVEVWQLSERLDGHPLSLFLLGKTFNESPVSLQAFIAEYEVQLLTAQDKYKDIDHRQRTLYASIDTSVRYLSPDLRSLFSKLWLFHASFLPETAIGIVDPDAKTRGEERSPVADQLHALWQRGLLARERSAEQGMLLYRVPPVIRPYIERYLAEESERVPLLVQYGSVYARLTRYLHDELDRGPLTSALAALFYEDLERGCQQVTGIEQGYYLLQWGWILQRLGDRVQGLALTEQALESAQELDQRLLFLAMYNMALVYRIIGRPQEALRLYEQALPIRREVGDRLGEATTLSNMAEVYSNIGRPQDALRLLEQALPITKEVGDHPGEAITLSRMAEVYSNIGRPQEALRLYEQALPITKEVGDRTGEAGTLSNMADVYSDISCPQEALRLYEQALSIRCEVGDRAGEAATLHNTAGVYQAIGRPQEALHLYEQALPITKEVGDRTGEAATLSSMAQVYQTIGRPQEALRLYEQVLPMRREVGDRAGEATTLSSMALVYQTIGRPQDAFRLFEQALPIRRQVGDRAGEAATLNGMAKAYNTINRPQEALRLYEQALPIQREVGNRTGEAATLHGMAYLYEKLHRFGEARDAFEQFIRLAKDVSHPAGEVSGLVGLALLLYRHLHQEAEAITKMEQALAIMHKTGLLHDATGRTPQQLAQVLQAMRDGTFSRGQSGASSTKLAKQIEAIVGHTVAVISSMPERHAEWREAMIQAMQDAKQRGATWQIETEFFTAILAILDGQSPMLPADHPYARAITAIQDGIARGGLASDEDNEDDVPEEELAAFVQACVASLRSTNPQEKMAYMQQLIVLQGQAPDDEMKALFQALQLALFGGDLIHLGDHLTGLARQVWEMIVAGVQQDDLSLETPPDGA